MQRDVTTFISSVTSSVSPFSSSCLLSNTCSDSTYSLTTTITSSQWTWTWTLPSQWIRVCVPPMQPGLYLNYMDLFTCTHTRKQNTCICMWVFHDNLLKLLRQSKAMLQSEPGHCIEETSCVLEGGKPIKFHKFEPLVQTALKSCSQGGTDNT